MAFQKVSFDRLAKFNSSSSSDLLETYNSYVNRKIIEASEEIPNKSFSPSAFRCDRRSWFKLRGVQPDPVAVDRVLDFSANIGTACHRIIQTNLKECLGGRWVDIEYYLKSSNLPWEYSTESRDGGLETLVTIKNPPVRFACDGLVEIDGNIYLLEIKSTTFSSWDSLTRPKDHHIDQVNCYGALLDVNAAIFMYIDRQYGDIKCYEHKIPNDVKVGILNRFNRVMNMVDKNIAPLGLPVGDPWCLPSMCPYYKKCQEYGR